VVQSLKAALRLSDLPVSRRATPLLDSAGIEAQWSAGAMHFSTGLLAGRRVLLALTDRAKSGGALGTEECLALEEAMKRAQDNGMAVLLLLASGGARLDQGLAALGAFRRLFAAVLAARGAAVKLFAVVHRDCFGGASLLACACPSRIGITGGRLGLSGPAIVEALGGKSELDASDREAVDRLFGVEARHAAGILTALSEDRVDALHRVLVSSLAGGAPDDLLQTHETLRGRLLRAGVVLPSPTPPWTGFAGARQVNARDCWLAADWLVHHRALKLDIALDAPGQATTRLDEALGLSEYVVHLARCLMRLRERGTAVNVDIFGQAGGAVYVALAAPASRVIAHPGACVRVLPQEAVSRVLRSSPPPEDIDRARVCGVVDEVLA
jgi:malonate decarboxylase beta subunit